VLFTHPAVKEAASTGAPDPYYGETVRAFVVLNDGARIGACKKNLAPYKVPSQIYLIEALPRTTVGKIDKLALRERLSSPLRA
jgi:long-chain acyl-CoA synthetase